MWWTPEHEYVICTNGNRKHTNLGNSQHKNKTLIRFPWFFFLRESHVYYTPPPIIRLNSIKLYSSQPHNRSQANTNPPPPTKNRKFLPRPAQLRLKFSPPPQYQPSTKKKLVGAIGTKKGFLYAKLLPPSHHSVHWSFNNGPPTNINPISIPQPASTIGIHQPPHQHHPLKPTRHAQVPPVPDRHVL